jgi:hypothetical protein
MTHSRLFACALLVGCTETQPADPVSSPSSSDAATIIDSGGGGSDAATCGPNESCADVDAGARRWGTVDPAGLGAPCEKTSQCPEGHRCFDYSALTEVSGKRCVEESMSCTIVTCIEDYHCTIQDALGGEKVVCSK